MDIYDVIATANTPGSQKIQPFVLSFLTFIRLGIVSALVHKLR
jgi:hypothetical protein